MQQQRLAVSSVAILAQVISPRVLRCKPRRLGKHWLGLHDLSASVAQGLAGCGLGDLLSDSMRLLFVFFGLSGKDTINERHVLFDFCVQVHTKDSDPTQTPFRVERRILYLLQQLYDFRKLSVRIHHVWGKSNGVYDRVQRGAFSRLVHAAVRNASIRILNDWRIAQPPRLPPHSRSKHG